MGYEKIEFGALMTENKDGTPKKEPFIYRPMNRPPILTIPPEPNAHARPVVRLSGPDVKPVVLSFHDDGIIARCGDDIRRLVTFDLDLFEIDN